MHRNLRGDRSGIVLVCVLVLLGISIAIMLGIVTFSLAGQRQAQREHQLAQTEWMLDAGVRFARQQLANGRQPSEGTFTTSLNPGVGKTCQFQIEQKNTEGAAGHLRVTASITGATPATSTVRSCSIDLETETEQ